MLLNVLVTFAAFERDLIIERTRTAVIGGKSAENSAAEYL
jgi:DNA invertase Pin-like site-specific DNA recombinase